MEPGDRPAFPGGGRFRRLGASLRERFGRRVHKVTLRGGFGCPNRDGRIGKGGCTFCSPGALVPRTGPVDEQLSAGTEAVERRFGPCAAIAYFQEGTATDAPVERLAALYREAIGHPKVAALSVGTRPDCLPDEVLDLLAGLARTKPVWLELGLQTANDRILRAVNRGHSVAHFVDAVRRARDGRGLEVVAHVILDLPTETASDRRATAACLNDLGVEGVKIHNLHVLADTPLAAQYRSGRLRLAPLEEYAEMAADFLRMLDPAMVIHRLTGEGPADLMLAPGWGRDKRRILAGIETALEAGDAWQGDLAGSS